MSDVLTVEKIHEAIKALGPPPPEVSFFSLKTFPKAAMVFEVAEGGKLVIAHPDFWSSIPAKELSYSDVFGGMGRFPIINLDINLDERIRVMGLIASAAMERSGMNPNPLPTKQG